MLDKLLMKTCRIYENSLKEDADALNGEEVQSEEVSNEYDTGLEITPEITESIYAELGLAEKGIDKEAFAMGLATEASEHADVAAGDPKVAALIAVAHLSEIPDYYVRLKAMEEAYKAEQEAPAEDEVPAEEAPAEPVGGPIESKKADEGKQPAVPTEDPTSPENVKKLLETEKK